MKRYSLVCLIILLGIKTQAQVPSDSLWAIWQNKSLPDTTRLKAISNLGIHVLNMKPDSTIYLSRLQEDFARNTPYKGSTRYRGADYYLADAIFFRGRAFMTLGKFDSANVLLEKAESLFRASEYPVNTAMSIQAMGVIQAMKGEMEPALEYFHRALSQLEEPLTDVSGEKVKKIRITKTTGAIYSNIGNIYYYRGDHARSMQYYGEALKIARQLDDLRSAAGSLENIGNACLDLELYQKAIDYYEEALETYERLEEEGVRVDIQIAHVLENLGSVYLHESEYEKSLRCLKRSLRICEETGAMNVIGMTLNELGMWYKEQGKADTSLSYFERSLAVAKERGDQLNISFNLYHIGDTYYLLGAYDQSISYCKEAFELAKALDVLNYQKIASKTLSNAYQKLGDYQEGLRNYHLYIQLKDSMAREENQRAQISFEYQQQALQDSLEFSKREAIQDLKLKNQQTLSAGIGLGLLLLLILLIVIFNRLRVTRRQKAEIEAQKQRAERSERYKEQFLANMSHEIRTPMHAISGMIKILERNEHPRTQDVFLEAMKKSSETLLILLNDILDLSKVEAGKLEIEHLPFQPQQEVEAVARTLQLKANEKGLTFEYFIAEDIPDWIIGDPTRLNQILMNLAGNAIKFTEKGRVDILLNRKADFMLIEVRDTGIGIPEALLPSIFDAFQQGEKGSANRLGGTGLGLNISRRLVELLGGNIWVESEAGKGSSFFVSLPLVEADEKQADEAQTPEVRIKEMGKALRGIQILLVEDNEFNQMIAEDDLAHYIPHVKIDKAIHGGIACSKYETGSYDLILMDVQMPEVDGIEASLRIREWEKAQGKSPIPIIAMTASLLKSEVNLCLEAGMDSYIPKPYQIEELIGTIYGELN